jgi:hypothetical protein
MSMLNIFGRYVKSSLLFWEDGQLEIRLVARAILGGMHWIQRLRAIACERSFSVVLEDALKKIVAPRKLLLVAHGEDGRFMTRTDSKGFGEALPSDWWKISYGGVSVFAFGCSSLECFDEYELGGKLQSYLGYKSEINFFVGNRRGRRIFQTILGRIGERFLETTSIDEEFKLGLEEDYGQVMESIKRRNNIRGGDRLSLIFLEEQIQGLGLLKGEM